MLKDNNYSIISRVIKNIKIKFNTNLNDYICCLCLNEIEDSYLHIYVCPECRKCFCLYASNSCDGFFLYMSYGWRTCPMCKTEI